MHLTRRQIFAAPSLFAQAPSLPAAHRRQRFAVSSYSYWHFKGERVPIETVIDDASRLGFDGVEILHRQMTDESTAYLNKLKRQAFRRVWIS